MPVPNLSGPAVPDTPDARRAAEAAILASTVPQEAYVVQLSSGERLLLQPTYNGVGPRAAPGQLVEVSALGLGVNVRVVARIRGMVGYVEALGPWEA